jgi:hypothetical protein
MPPTDPIAPIVSALSVLAAPNPALNTASPQAPSVWTGGSATDGTLYVPVQTLLGLLFGISGDLTAVGNGINTGLTDVANAVAAIAVQVASLAAAEGDAVEAFTALQTVLGLAQSLAPSGTTNVLQSASGLFQQLQSLISVLNSLPMTAAELAELAQQLTAAAALFPSA